MAGEVRIAVVGAGSIGRYHAHSVAFRIPEAELVAVVDSVEDAARALAEATNAGGWYVELDSVLGDPSVDAVVLASPGHTHAELIRRAASAGKHVFCEKPIGLDLTAIDDALSEVDRTGVKLQLGFQRRFDRGYVRARQLLDEGVVGRTYMVHSRTRDPHLPPPEYLQICGGLFRDTMVHDFDSIRFLAGCEVRSVYAVGSVLVDPAVATTGDVDTAFVTMELADGGLATIDNSRQAVYGYDVRAEVFGSEGALVVDQPNLTSTRRLGREGIVQDHVYWYLDRFAHAYEEELRDFVRCVRMDSPTSVTGEDGRAATVLALAAEESLCTGAPVRLSTASADKEAGL
ncbi:MAG: inositol 2-dehydrogenase [Chloroflexota bacterium]|nr:inositol 2-dehydrogenase [Chloroflexota bacterium]